MTNSSAIRIGTRRSELATWQANKVAEKLQNAGCETELVFISSEGDLDRITPLAQMGAKGVFTKALDDALLNHQIDLAVHSYKDLPTDNPLPLKVAAVMERADPRDTLVARNGTEFLDDADYEAVIATGSNRRKAQWLHRYPHHKIVSLRGNVNTRLAKIEKNRWNGAIFAAAGLLRINLGRHISQYLDWMVSAPGQGAMAVMIREENHTLESIVSKLNHKQTALCTKIERDFLHDMEAGCSSPVGAFAYIKENEIHFKAIALTLDGKKRFNYEKKISDDKAHNLGHTAAVSLLKDGAIEVINEMKSQ